MIDRRRPALALAACLVLVATGCGRTGDGGAPSTVRRVESPVLGIALADLPQGFKVDSVGQEDGAIHLARAEGLPAGTLVVEADPEQQAGINLVEAVREQKAHIESLPDGKYLGNVELGSPIGTAYSTRGRYQDQGREVEEVRLLAVHPGANRLLSIIYRYPAGGDTKERIEQALAVLGEVEPLSPGS